jgi:Phytanoyl-CoA dioxygenase (PhyH)
MVDKEYLLNSIQMAQFVARGFLRFDELIPKELNEAIMRDIDGGEVKAQAAGTPLSQCYPPPSAVGEMLRLPQVAGIIQSLVGADPLFDHQAVHVREPNEDSAQHLHGDSTIDTRMAFDIQLMYFPHDVSPDMGGTLILPGSQYRRINEMDIARYQNFIGQIQTVCKAGTVLVVHHGIWHCGRQNKSSQKRYMFKVRLNPTERQLRLWNTDDLTDQQTKSQIIFGGSKKVNDVQGILDTQEPWFENGDGRLEIINRIKQWRFLSGDETFDAHYWLTRLENVPEALAE